MDKRKKKLALLVVDEELEQCIPDKNGCTSLRKIFLDHFVTDFISMTFIQTNQELLDYLYHRGEYGNPSEFPFPDLIIIDYYNPKTDRKEVLEQIKSHPHLQSIPILVLSRSEGQDEISDYYKLRANSYISKPGTAEELIRTVQEIRRYWFETISLPQTPA
jgi:CheY-like chemotaxis protein